MKFSGTARSPVEFAVQSTRRHRDIFNEAEVDVIFKGPKGLLMRVPAFWAGGSEFRVRFAAPVPGHYEFQSVCTDHRDAGLNGCHGTLDVEPYGGGHRLYRHGRLRVAGTKRHLEHEDGTPFFWLGDTWWMGLCKRFRWPEDFRSLAADRVAKGYTVVQIIAGLYPDMPAFDPRGLNEAGFPWKRDYSGINPEYFDMADLRIDWLVKQGLVPCIVGAWGYHLPWMGVKRLKQHWRNLVARFGAYPVTWCIAGEAAMAYYLSKTHDKDIEDQKRGWTEIMAYVRNIDPYRNPITIHPTDNSRNQVENTRLLDFEMLQTGHGDRQSLPNTVNSVVAARKRRPRMPVLVAEVCYEGIGEFCRQDVQRLMFWTSILNGACGHTYGANGIWQVNTREKPYGPSPHGMAWGNTPWDEAANLPGSRQLGIAKALLERFEWWKFEPHPEWMDPRWSVKAHGQPHAAGISGTVRIFYMPGMPWGKVVIKRLERGASYRTWLFNPVNGEKTPVGVARGNARGDWMLQESWHKFAFPLYQDWVLVMERKGR